MGDSQSRNEDKEQTKLGLVHVVRTTSSADILLDNSDTVFCMLNILNVSKV